MRILAILAVACFILAQTVNLVGYTDAIRSGDMTLAGLVIYDPVLVATLLFSLLVFWPVLRQKTWIAPILLILFIFIPLYHLYNDLMYWYIHGVSFYSQFQLLTGTRIFFSKFVLVLGVPYTFLWFQNRASRAHKKTNKIDACNSGNDVEG